MLKQKQREKARKRVEELKKLYEEDPVENGSDEEVIHIPLRSRRFKHYDYAVYLKRKKFY